MLLGSVHYFRTWNLEEYTSESIVWNKSGTTPGTLSQLYLCFEGVVPLGRCQELYLCFEELYLGRCLSWGGVVPGTLSQSYTWDVVSVGLGRCLSWEEFYLGRCLCWEGCWTSKSKFINIIQNAKYIQQELSGALKTQHTLYERAIERVIERSNRGGPNSASRVLS